MKKRIDWIDETKGWGILCIMMAHVVQYFQATTSLNVYLCSFHVPIFFVVTGCMDKQFCNKKLDLKKRTYALLVPYVIFSIFNFVSKVAVYGLMNRLSASMIKNELVELFITGNGTVWFLLTLWIMTLLAQYGLKRLPHDWMILLVGILILLVNYSVQLPQHPLLVVCIRPFVALGYWTIGYVICSFLDQFSANVFWSIAFIGLGGLMVWISDVRVDFFGGNFYGLTSIVASLSSSLGYVLLFCWMSRKHCFQLLQRFLSYFGRNSLIVMLIHPIWLQCFMYPLGRWFGALTGMASLGMAILVLIVIVILEVPSIRIMNRYLGVLIGKKNKLKVDV